MLILCHVFGMLTLDNFVWNSNVIEFILNVEYSLCGISIWIIIYGNFIYIQLLPTIIFVWQINYDYGLPFIEVLYIVT